ncbi:MAG: nitroreductase family protein [Bradymonadales bacterium]|nr:nitroreductase family protein [Bradymonadales bacterium]
MDFSEIIRNRRSIRSFTSQPVDEATVQQLLEIIRTAPTAGNRQAYRLYVIRDPQIRRGLAAAAYHQDFLAEAPVCLAFFADPNRSLGRYGSRGANLYCLQDATIAATFAWMAIVDQGLASVWVGAFDEEAVCRVIQSPPDLRPVALLPIGHPAENPEKTPRRPLDEMVVWR